ncbi:DUF58 domain-containing protein [Paenibacillus sp. H1-7]|uniref:DUF58 domain-containing protein n=1 Tax=Paenibacillus sp. H1-7 TaxID=2282849 RepID=UPI001EF7C521|nr:DUF58 domain-containing protein [Paenibacillus sp. H1-7]ULL19066.1 DUF58 domain-containing protein [Paenibacillus sp. H1-7]
MRNIATLLLLFAGWAGSWYWAEGYGGRSAWICFYGLGMLLLYLCVGYVSWSRAVRIERPAQTQRYWSGEAIGMKLRIKPGGWRLPSGWLLVEERWTHTGTGESVIVRDTVRLTMSGAVQASLHVPGLPRGAYSLEQTRVGISDAFGLLRLRLRSVSAGQHRMLVLPKPLPLASAATAAGEELPRRPQLRLQRQASSPLVQGTRPYAPGDPLNRIHWRSTARTGMLRAKETEQPGFDRLLVCLDAAKGVANAAAFATAVEAAAGIAQRGLQLGLRVRLAASDRQGQAAEARGGERFTELLELLAQLPCDGDLPFAASVQREAQQAGPGAGVAVVTAQPDEQLLRLLYRLRGREVHMVYVHGKGAAADAAEQWRQRAEAAGCRFTAVSASGRRAAAGGEGHGAEANRAAAGA